MWDGRRLAAVNVDFITSPGGSDVVNRQVNELRTLRARLVKLADACKSSIAGVSEQLKRARAAGILPQETLVSFEEEVLHIREDLAQVSCVKERVLKPHKCLSALVDVQDQVISLRNALTRLAPSIRIEESDVMTFDDSESELVPEEYEISVKEPVEAKEGENRSQKHNASLSGPNFQPRPIVAKPLPPCLPPRIVSANFLPDVDECSSSDEVSSPSPFSAGTEAAKLKSRFSELRDIAQSFADPASTGDQSKLRQFHAGILELMDSAAASPNPLAGDPRSIDTRRKKLEIRFLAVMARLNRDDECVVDDGEGLVSKGRSLALGEGHEESSVESTEDVADDAPNSEYGDSVSVVSDGTEFLDEYSEDYFTEIDDEDAIVRDAESERDFELQCHTQTAVKSGKPLRKDLMNSFSADMTTNASSDSVEPGPRKHLNSRISGLRDIAKSFDSPKTDEDRKSSLSELHVGVMGLLDSAMSAAPGTSGAIRIQRIKERLELKYHSAMSSFDSEGDNFELTQHV